MQHPTRKANRLKGYDYSSGGYYHITICTKNMANFLWTTTPVGASLARPDLPLSDYGKIVERTIQRIPLCYPSVEVDKYVIMPNHIHMIICIHDDGRAGLAPTISRIVQQTKGLATKQIGHSIWHKSFYDEIIRTEADYLRIWNYIDANPFQWTEDEYWFEE